MVKFVIAMLSPGLLLLTVAGCSDDKGASWPNTTVLPAAGKGVCVLTDNAVWQRIEINERGLTRPIIDSAGVRDSRCKNDMLACTIPEIRRTLQSGVKGD